VWWPGKRIVPLLPMQVVKGDQNRYPVPGGIAGPPCPGGYKFGGLALQVGGWATGWQPVTVKKLIVRKPKMWPRNSQNTKTELTRRGPLRRWRSALDCSATEEEKKKLRNICRLFSNSWSICWNFSTLYQITHHSVPNIAHGIPTDKPECSLCYLPFIGRSRGCWRSRSV
jgi:hypothetical protein